MIDDRTRTVWDGFRDHSLPKSDWTHEAHLRACWAALSAMGTDPALTLLRDGIRSYNVATGVANTATSGYHETLTVYFVTAIADLRAATIDDVIASARATTVAPLRHWSRDVLFGIDARASWVEPDLAPLPWSTRPAGIL